MRQSERARAWRGALVLMWLGPTLATARAGDVRSFGPPRALGPATSHGEKPCLSPAERARVAAEIATFHQLRPEPDPASDQHLGTGPGLRFHPMGGRPYRDLWLNNYVDLDPTAGILDWDCSAFTYDGHLGNDTVIRSFLEQEIGVPVFAAMDGVVVAAHDGEEDDHTSCSGTANYVILDHGGGQQTLYAHLRRYSVAVQVGEAVAAGEQLGQTGSSGCSSWPHLHFAVMQDGQTVEPWSGGCQPAPTLWRQQLPIARYVYASDFAFSRVTLEGLEPVHGLPRTGQVALADPATWFWITGHNLAPNSTLRVRVYRPSGALEFDSGTQSFGNSTYLRWWWWWWTLDLPGMHQLPGTWRLQLTVNDRVLADAPLEVVATYDADFNRPPEPVSLSLSPTNPSDDEAISCLVDTPLVVDDLDYDLLRFRYRWKVDGAVVRDVVSAGLADALPARTARFGQTVSCTVTPNDGRADGPPATIQHRMDCLGSETARVHARMNLFGGGHGRPDAPSGAGEGYPPVEIRLSGELSEALRFVAVSGSVSAGAGGWNGPDGGTLHGGRTNVGSYDGLAGILHDHRTMFLAGVFLDGSEPRDPAPVRLDATQLGSSPDVFPSLRQVFFIGDGLTGTGSGELQRFHAPLGATRLVLGFAEAPGFVGAPGSYHDNAGELTMTIEHMALPTCGCAAEPYCESSPNSAGAGAFLSAEGTTSLAADELALRVDGASPNQFGVFYYGPAQIHLPFGDGVRCVGAGGVGIFRLTPTQVGGGGAALQPLDFDAAPLGSGPGRVSPGDTWNFQFWYRDPAAGGSGFNYSDALEVTFCP